MIIVRVKKKLFIINEIVYYESRKREVKTSPIYQCRCDDRLKTKSEKSTLLGYTGLLGELEPLKIETKNLHSSDTLGCSGNWNTERRAPLFVTNRKRRMKVMKKIKVYFQQYKKRAKAKGTSRSKNKGRS